jgi:transposase
MPIVAGVDTHKETHHVAILDAVGKLLKSFEIQADPDGYAKAIDHAKTYNVESWGLEGTGSYGRAFAQALVAAGYNTVFEVPGIVTKRHRKHSTRIGKSDALDAQAIAEAVLRESERLPQFQICTEQEALRLRYDQRDRLVRERTTAINRLHSAALRLGMKDEVPSNMTSDAAVARLRAKLEAHAARDIIEEAFLDEMLFELTSLDRLNGEIRRIERVMRPFIQRLAPELLDMRGVSTIVGAGLLGHAGDVRAMRTAGAFAMRSATAPISWSSGRHHALRINTGGDRQLNRLLHVIALVQTRTDDHPGRIYYEKKIGEGKTRRSAIRSLKRHLATVVFFRLKQAFERISPVEFYAAAA